MNRISPRAPTVIRWGMPQELRKARLQELRRTARGREHGPRWSSQVARLLAISSGEFARRRLAEGDWQKVKKRGANSDKVRPSSGSGRCGVVLGCGTSCCSSAVAPESSFKKFFGPAAGL